MRCVLGRAVSFGKDCVEFLRANQLKEVIEIDSCRVLLSDLVPIRRAVAEPQRRWPHAINALASREGVIHFQLWGCWGLLRFWPTPGHLYHHCHHHR